MEFSLPQFWTDKYKVYSYHTDWKQRLSLVSLMYFLQETAGNHAGANGFGFDALSAGSCFWVLSRVEIQVVNYPKWEEELTLRTWSKKPNALTGNRDFELLNAQGKIVALASTVWLMVDINTRRPQRIEKFGTEFPHAHGYDAIEESPAKLPAVTSDTPSQPKEIVPSDIDMNGHTNNTCYVRWVLDSLPFDELNSKKIKKLEVNFILESRLSEHYTIHTQATENSGYASSIVRTEDGKELARVRVSL